MNAHIEKYRAKLRERLDFGGSQSEQTIRGCFIAMVNAFAESRGLVLVPELDYRTAAGTTVRPDGTLKDRFRLSYGYYEAKDPQDDLDAEIEAKTQAHYPLINTIFENSLTAVLYQNNAEVMRINMQNDRDLEALITRFLDFEREEIFSFKKALFAFTQDLPDLIVWCREQINGAKQNNDLFVQKMNVFLEQCREEVNCDFCFEDVREILIQHILTDKLFSAVLSEGDFHKNNNIAKHINDITETFFTQEKRKQFEAQNKHFYAELSRAAAGITDFHDKEGFLKTLYAEFYKAYNPKESDRLGVVYTPGEIVDFMIKTSDALLDRHFNTGLAEKGVQIIDPACGTGTFITALIDYIPLSKLQYKYLNEIYANEVSILPYYIANLNIEYTYWQKVTTNTPLASYEVFPNISYTDTLENCRYLVDAHGQGELGNILTAENTKRIWTQNEAEISVVIGNPPYNAHQKNYNDQNANKVYPALDKRIRETFTVESRARKTQYEDMYFRFYRWGIDRLGAKKGGLIAFITNRSFVDAINTDGFRATMEKEFDYLYIVDLQGDVRKDAGSAGKSNVFGIMTGVAIMFAIKLPKAVTLPNKEGKEKRRAVVHYYDAGNKMSAKEKLIFLRHTDFYEMEFSRLYPDENHTWLNKDDTGFAGHFSVWEQDGIQKSESAADSIFYKCFPSVHTARNKWVYDFSRENLIKKIKQFIKIYNKSIKEGKQDFSIKWSHSLTDNYNKKIKAKFNENKIISVMFRPFVQKYYYADVLLSDRLTKTHLDCIGIENNIYISFCGIGHNHGFFVLASKYIFDLDVLEKSQCIPFYILDKSSKKICNIKDAALAGFRKNYNDNAIQKEDIFHYIYAVFNSAEYRETYRHDLRRERPRIPLDENFWKWAKQGADLMNAHVNFEESAPYPLKIKKAKENETWKTQLKFDKKNLRVIMDEYTISGFPKEIFDYKLGIRSPVEWVVDQYKKDYAEYKNDIIALFGKFSADIIPRE